jgi:hypothetical protein
MVMEHVQGGCQCGAIRYRLEGGSERINLCHCRMCQRAHGAPVVAWVTIRADRVVMLGESAQFYRSSERAERGFCSRCGSPMFWRLLNQTDSPERLIDVAAASLDDPTLFAPSEHLWVSSAMPWLQLADHLPRYPKERIS